jgi:two-component system, chemotaxis family, response regulator Rcp1
MGHGRALTIAMLDGRPLTILQVEDTPSDAALTAYAMRIGEIPHSLHVVVDGAKALEFLRRTGPYFDAPRPDLILLDLELPRLNGNEVLQVIKNDEKLRTIPVIVFSAEDTAASKKHAYELHANSYVVKPLTMDAFTKKVQSIADYWSNTSEISMLSPSE